MLPKIETAPATMTIKMASGHMSASVNLRMRRNITMILSSQPTRGTRPIKDEAAATVSMLRKVPWTLVTFIPTQRKHAAKKIPTIKEKIVSIVFHTFHIVHIVSRQRPYGVPYCLWELEGFSVGVIAHLIRIWIPLTGPRLAAMAHNVCSKPLSGHFTFGQT